MKGTIKSNIEMERLFREGRRFSLSLVSIVVCPAPVDRKKGRYAFIAGKKLGSAPLRNRCKRVIRHCVKEVGELPDGMDVVFIARRRIAYAPHDKAVSEIQSLLAKAKTSIGEIDG